MYIDLFNSSKCNAALKLLQLLEVQIKVDQIQKKQNLKLNTNNSKYSLLLSAWSFRQLLYVYQITIPATFPSLVFPIFLLRQFLSFVIFVDVYISNCNECYFPDTQFTEYFPNKVISKSVSYKHLE